MSFVLLSLCRTCCDDYHQLSYRSVYLFNLEETGCPAIYFVFAGMYFPSRQSMKDSPIMSAVTTLLLVLLPLARAQSLNTCATPNNLSSSFGISFTTFSVPVSPTCINLNETFTSQTSDGFTAAEGNTHYQSSGNGAIGVNWTVSGGFNFSPNTNYSHIFYQQVNTSDDGTSGRGEAAERYVKIHPEYGCKDGSDYLARPLYGYSCQSGAGGQCNQAAYSVASFEIVVGSQVNTNGRKCLDFAEEGGAIRLDIPVRALSTVVAAIVWLWML
nr:hypothetical protein CFP56_46774 [Quercus suber]